MSDKGFYVANDIVKCEEAGITVFMPIPAFNPTKRVGVPEPEFGSERFIFDAVKDVYVCPVGKELGFWKCSFKGKPECGSRYRTVSCAYCTSRSRCTRNRRGRIMVRWEYQDAVDRLRARLMSSEGKEKVRLRRMLAEHPFGTMKRAFNQGYLLLKGQKSQRRSRIYYACLQYEVGLQYSWSWNINGLDEGVNRENR